MPHSDDPLVKEYDKDTGEPIHYMNLDEIKERADLNIANTATALRAKVIAHLAKANGNSTNRI